MDDSVSCASSNCFFALLLVGNHGISDRIRGVFRPGQTKHSKSSKHAIKSSASDENVSNWKSTAYSTTKLAVNLVKESADAFPPLKSVVGGLSAILDHCDVWFISPAPPLPPRLQPFQQTMACRQTIESLIPRVEGLAQSLGGPAPEGEVKEGERREVLKR